MRLKNIDFFKGLLILLVIVGHTLKVDDDQSVWVALIYSFHMPLFIGLSGYLFNARKVASLNFAGLMDKYKMRVILPWVIAVLVHLLLAVAEDHEVSVWRFFKAFLFPFFHLWFIPAFLSWIVLTWGMRKLRLNRYELLIAAFLISVGTLLVSKVPELYRNKPMLNYGIDMIVNTFRWRFFFFFALGHFLRDVRLKRPKGYEYVITLLLFSLVPILHYSPNSTASFVLFFAFNAMLLILVLKISVKDLIPEFHLLEWIGVNSLAIYLWHVLPIKISVFLVGTDNILYFYALTTLLELGLLLVYSYLVRITVMRKVVFGM